MNKKEGAATSPLDQTLSLGSQAWNVADGYTKIKILRLLVQLDRYENIALYGLDDMDDFLPDENYKAQRREEAIKRFMTTLRQLLGNVKFALKKEDKPRIDGYLERLQTVSQYIGAIAKTEDNMITHETTLRIDEEHFNKSMKILQEIKDEVNIPINNAGLIFRNSDEIDLDKVMTEIVEGG